MASDKKKPEGKASSSTSTSRRSRRPARTIELEAEEVEAADEQVDGEAAAADADKVDPSKAGDDKDKPDEAKKDGASSPKKEDAKSLKDAAKTGKPKPPPQRTKPSDVRSFVTHLAAGLVGGLIGVVGAGVGLDRLPFLSGETGKEITGVGIEEINRRVEEISTRVDGQADTLKSVARADALKALGARIESIEKIPAPAPELPGEVSDRIGKLEETLSTLQKSAGGENATSLEQAAALTARIDGVEESLSEKAQALEKELAGLRESIDAIKPAEGSVSQEALSGLTRQIEELGQKISDLESRPTPAPATAEVKPDGRAALSLAYESLRRTANEGKPFASQLEALNSLATGELDTKALVSHAQGGIPSTGELLKQLPPLLADARQAALRSDDKTFMDRLLSNAQSVVRIRRIGPGSGSGPAATLSRMQDLAGKSDLAGIVVAAKSLEGAAIEPLKPWVEKAKARLALDDALDALEAGLIAEATTASGKAKE